MRSFDNDLKNYDLSNAYREIVEKILRAYFHTEKVYKVNSKEHFYAYVLEKMGIDYVIILQQEEEEGEGRELFKKIITIQLKIRDSKYYMKDICVEVMHESLQDRSKSLGYIFDIKADYILYSWGKDNKLLPSMLLISVDRLKRFFWLNKSKYELIPTKGSYSADKEWITYNMFIPLEDCSNCYEIIKVEED